MTQLTKEEELFCQRMRDKCNRAIDSYCPMFTCFLDARQKMCALEVFKGYSGQLRTVSFGGFSEAERVVVGVFPIDVYGYVEDEKELYEQFDVSALEIKGSGFSGFTHRDVLGSVLGLGIKREVVGDIYLPDDKSAYICLSGVAAQYVKDNLEFVARDKVKVNLVSVDLLPEAEKKYAVISGTVSSDRLDCIVALCTNQSREKAKLMINSGSVNLNHFEETRCDLPVRLEDVISVRGYGRFVLKENGTLTRKGRLKTVVHKMI